MSIILKGIDMPKGCDETCPLYLAGQCCEGCDCPIIEIPTPHGRLIDESELIKSYMRGTKTGIDDFYDTIGIIDNAPTILEAEE